MERKSVKLFAYEVAEFEEKKERIMNSVNPDQKIDYPVYSLQSGRWQRGGIWGTGTRTIPLYEKNEQGNFVQFGVGLY